MASQPHHSSQIPSQGKTSQGQLRGRCRDSGVFYVSSPDRNLNWRQDLITSTVKVFVSCSDLSFENCEDVVTICLGNDGKFNYQGYFYIALPLLRTHFDVWPLIANKNAEWSSRKYLILRRAHISVCPSTANQRLGQVCRPIRGSEETSRDPHRDQQDLGCFKSPLLCAPECFIPVSHHFVCARGNKGGGSGRVV